MHPSLHNEEETHPLLKSPISTPPSSLRPSLDSTRPPPSYHTHNSLDLPTPQTEPPTLKLYPQTNIAFPRYEYSGPDSARPTIIYVDDDDPATSTADAAILSEHVPFAADVASRRDRRKRLRYKMLIALFAAVFTTYIIGLII